jgi:hypothetical protein
LVGWGPDTFVVKPFLRRFTGATHSGNRLYSLDLLFLVLSFLLCAINRAINLVNLPVLPQVIIHCDLTSFDRVEQEPANNTLDRLHILSARDLRSS